MHLSKIIEFNLIELYKEAVSSTYFLLILL